MTPKHSHEAIARFIGAFHRLEGMDVIARATHDLCRIADPKLNPTHCGKGYEEWHQCNYSKTLKLLKFMKAPRSEAENLTMFLEGFATRIIDLDLLLLALKKPTLV